MPKKSPGNPAAKPADSQPANCAVASCQTPCKPISGITVTSVTYRSDHDLLKNNGADWRDTGVRYPKPEWTTANAGSVGAPISHTMDKTVRLTVVVRVDPSDACAEAGLLEGRGPGNLLFSPQGTLWQPGANTLTFESATKLPKQVTTSRLEIQWTATAPAGRFVTTTTDFCFITMDTPINRGQQEDGVTLKRMLTAVGFVEPVGSLDPHTIVAALMKKIPFYTLQTDPAVPADYHHPTYFNASGGAWPIADAMSSYAECQAIVRFVRGIIDQVGCPGQADAVVIWADPDVSGGATAIESPLGQATLHNKRKTVAGVVWQAALAATTQPLAAGQDYPQGSMMNMYEACLKFTYNGVTKYYGGGAGVSDTPAEVIKCFAALVWYRAVPQPDGSIKNHIEDVVHRY